MELNTGDVFQYESWATHENNKPLWVREIEIMSAWGDNLVVAVRPVYPQRDEQPRLGVGTHKQIVAALENLHATQIRSCKPQV